jgi:hypothetical protein
VAAAEGMLHEISWYRILKICQELSSAIRDTQSATAVAKHCVTYVI